MAEHGGTRLTIIGGGVMGLMTAYYAAPFAAAVTILEKTRVGHPATASFSLTRSARNDYLDPEYARLAYEARQLWLDLQAGSEEPLLARGTSSRPGRARCSPSSPCSRGRYTTSAVSRPPGSPAPAGRTLHPMYPDAVTARDASFADAWDA